MKRIFIFLAAVMMAAGAMAQVVESAPRLVCIGNTYYYGKNVMSQRQMLDWYAQQNCQESNAHNQTREVHDVKMGGGWRPA